VQRLERLKNLCILFLALISAGQGQNLVQQGLQALQRGELPEARTDLEHASHIEPSNPIIWSALADVYLRSHEPALASSAAQAAEKNSKGNPVVSQALAIYYLKANNPQAALRLAKTAAQSDPHTAFTLAQVFLKRQDFTPAADLLQSALAKFPSDAQLTLALGVARYGQRRFDDAVATFLNVIALDPQIDQPYDFIGRMLDQAGPHLPAIERIFSDRAKANPDDAKAQFLYAKALLTADNRDPNAEPLLLKSIALDNNRWESHYELGALLANKHDYTDAAAELSRSIELNPNQPGSHYQLARVYDRLGQPERAKEEREIHRRLTATNSSGMQ
jgi:tetratricopeptide (TPR) repeat protein